jgi:hypothetical protein
VKAGATTITGEWQAVGTGNGTLTIDSAAAGATITAASATGLKASAAGATITQNAGEDNTLTIATGTAVDLGTTGSLVLTGVAGTDGAKLAVTNTGSLKAGATTITGAWQAVDTGADADTVTIAATSADTSSITASATTVAFTASTGGTITQGAVSSNTLTIGADTTIDLGGTAAEALGQLILTGHASTPGEIELTHATTSIVKTGLEAGTGAFTTAAKIGTKAFAAGTGGAAVITTDANGGTGKFATLTAGTAGHGLKGGDASNTVTIDSTQEVST